MRSATPRVPHFSHISLTFPSPFPHLSLTFLSFLTGAASATYPEVAAQLSSELAIENRSFRASVYHNCFIGAEAVDVLMRLYALPTREAAVGLGLTLQQVVILTYSSPNPHLLLIILTYSSPTGRDV